MRRISRERRRSFRTDLRRTSNLIALAHVASPYLQSPWRQELRRSMTKQTEKTAVGAQGVVAPIERGFQDFTEGIGAGFRPSTTSSRHGEGWEQTRDAVGSEGGWPGCLWRLAERLAG